MNSVERIVLMINQIAANLMHETDPAAQTAEHIRQFWGPRMRSQLLAHGCEGLSPVAQDAVALLN